ncbi:MAG: hypothetical protein ACUVTX_08390, partial [Bacteroidales bacterium]
MKSKLFTAGLLFMFNILLSGNPIDGKSLRLLVITGGHGYDNESFTGLLESLGPEITFEIAELPAAFDMFLPGNRNRYDVLLFYHMWQKITP